MTDKLAAADARAQRRVDRWTRLEVIVIALTAITLIAAVALAFFVIPIRNTVEQDHCIVHATAVASARYQSAVAKIQNVPIGPDRAGAAAEILASVNQLHRAIEGC